MAQQKRIKAKVATTDIVAPSLPATVEVKPVKPQQRSASITPMAYVDDTVTLKLSTGKSLRMSRGAAERWIKDHKNDKII